MIEHFAPSELTIDELQLRGEKVVSGASGENAIGSAKNEKKSCIHLALRGSVRLARACSQVFYPG